MSAESVESDLDELADKLVEAALNGDKAALIEISSALDDDNDETVDSDETLEPPSSPNPVPAEGLVIYRREDQTPQQAVAEAALDPTTRASMSVFELRRGKLLNQDLSINALIDALRDQVRKVTDRKLGRGEAMLTAQAHTLDAIYNDLVRRALLQEHAPHMEMFFKVALRAQSQCRATWEAISAIQNPPIAGYVGQANIANNQQINNSPSPARTVEKQNPPNKLLEHTTHEPNQWMDRGAPTAAERSDPALETVGEINRTQDTQR